MQYTKICVIGLGYVGLPLARLSSTKYPLSKDIKPIFFLDRAGDIKHSNADIRKAIRLLGYESEYDFARELNKAI